MAERVAILGAGKMGEALLSGLLRAGRSAGDLLFIERHPDRSKMLEERYGVTGVSATEAAETADTLLVAPFLRTRCSSPPVRRRRRPSNR